MVGTHAHRGKTICAFSVVTVLALLALGSGVAQAATSMSKLRVGSATGAENYLFAAGDHVVGKGSVTVGKHYRFVVSDPSGTVRATSACRPSPASGSVSNDYAVQSSDPVSTTTAWRDQLQEFNTADCSGAPAKTAQLYFDVARASSYSNASATLPKGVFGAATTAYVQVAGVGKVKASATNAQVTDWKTTWIAPGNGLACANTAGGDRPDATASALLPASSVAPGQGSTLRYRPVATATGDGWNREANYETRPCTDFSAADEGV